MRHVDDAHHAEGDGEADRGEQQDAAEADPLEEVLQQADEEELPLARGERGVRRLAQLLVGVGGAGELAEQAAHLRVGRAGEALHRGDALLLGAGVELDGDEAGLHRLLDLGVALGGERLLERGGGLRPAGADRVIGGAETVVTMPG